MSTETLASAASMSERTPKPDDMVVLYKRPDEPWRFTNVLLEGEAPLDAEENLLIQQVLVDGYIEAVGYPTRSRPYVFICNEDGHAQGMPRCVDLLNGVSLLGPVLLVHCRRGKDGWDTYGMSMRDGPAPHVEALQSMLGRQLEPDEIVVDCVFYANVHPKSDAREAVHA